MMSVMCYIYKKNHRKFGVIALVLLFLVWQGAGRNNSTPATASHPGILYDIQGREVSFEKIPESVVSLVPGITEMIQALCPDYCLKGVVSHDEALPVARKAIIVGGFLNPDSERLQEIQPELMFVSSLHHDVLKAFTHSKTHLILLQKHTVRDLYYNLRLIGKMFHCSPNAEKYVDRIQSQIACIQKKIEAIPPEKRLRVLRLMGGEQVMTPGDDSFQNEAIRLAGGIPIITGKNGAIVPIDLPQWKKFNPHYVYDCGHTTKKWQKRLAQTGWRDVIAVKENKYLAFPCNMTCRQSVHYGEFIQWLAASLYATYFFSSAPVKKNAITKERDAVVDLPYVAKAKIVYGTINDFLQKTFVLSLAEPSAIISTLEGYKRVSCIGNHYLSPPRWYEGHDGSISAMSEKICRLLEVDPSDAALLFTGVDMDNISIVKKTYKNIVVYACTTAGVKSNAQCQSKDQGAFHPVGTINSIILTNHLLSNRAMTRALITATEAKSLALHDLDIRSSYTPLYNGATGTGTDNLIIVGGKGKKIDLTGGHTKIGELIARAVYTSVLEAIEKQNHIKKSRSAIARLQERHISLYQIAFSASQHVDNALSAKIIMRELDHVIRRERIGAFIATSFAISDAYAQELIVDLADFEAHCKEIAADIAGKDVVVLYDITFSHELPLPVQYALQALVTGVIEKLRE